MSGSQAAVARRKIPRADETPEEVVARTSLSGRVSALEDELVQNTAVCMSLKEENGIMQGQMAELQGQIAALQGQMIALLKNTNEIVEVFNSWKGAFKVLEFLGKVATPIVAIAGMITGFVIWLKGGK